MEYANGNNQEQICFKVSGAISSNMVFQRDRAIRVWGSANTGNIKIFGEFMGEEKFTITEESGKWMLEFSAHAKTLVPQKMKIYTETGSCVEFDNLLIGDVYFITGQSNA